MVTRAEKQHLWGQHLNTIPWLPALKISTIGRIVVTESDSMVVTYLSMAQERMAYQVLADYVF